MTFPYTVTFNNENDEYITWYVHAENAETAFPVATLEYYAVHKMDSDEHKEELVLCAVFAGHPILEFGITLQERP